MITIALDMRGCLVHASEAKPGEVYYCIECRCVLVLVRRKGFSFFRRRAGEYHTGKNCSKRNVTRKRLQDIAATTAQSMLNRATKPAKKQQPSEDPSGIDSIPSYRRNRETEEVIRESYRSMKQMAEDGLLKCDSLVWEDGKQLTDILISQRTAHAIMGNNQSLDARIVQLRYLFCRSSDCEISMEMSVYKNDRPVTKKYFSLAFRSPELYMEYVKYFQQRKDRSFMVLGSWGAMTNLKCQNVCRFGKCGTYPKCTGAQWALIESPKQILSIEDGWE